MIPNIAINSSSAEVDLTLRSSKRLLAYDRLSVMFMDDLNKEITLPLFHPCRLESPEP